MKNETKYYWTIAFAGLVMSFSFYFIQGMKQVGIATFLTFPAYIIGIWAVSKLKI